MRNKFLIIVIVLLSITLISCKKKEIQPLAENEYNIYYLNTNINTLVESRYTAASGKSDTNGLIKELMTHFLRCRMIWKRWEPYLTRLHTKDLI